MSLSPSLRPSPSSRGTGRRTPLLLRLLSQYTPLVEGEMLGLSRVVRPGDVCVDVGANYGLYTHELSRLVGDAGLVHAVEPLPDAYRVLAALVSLRALGNVRTHQVALGEHQESSVLSVPWRHGLPVHGRAFLRSGARGEGANDEFRSSRDVEVAVRSLDGLVMGGSLRRVDFVKADVEGAELAILRGGAALLAAWHPTLLLEIEDRHTIRYGHRADDVLGWLAARGYRAYRWLDARWKPCTRWTAEARNYLLISADRRAPLSVG